METRSRKDLSTNFADKILKLSVNLTSLILVSECFTDRNLWDRVYKLVQFVYNQVKYFRLPKNVAILPSFGCRRQRFPDE